MRGNDQNLNIIADLPKNNVVRKPHDAAAPNIRRKFYPVAQRGLANFGHGRVKGGKITPA